MEHADWFGLAVAAAEGAGRSDLAERIRGALARVRRTDAAVCVVGEFKQGKSSLINALLGEPVCPVDDDLATTVITVVHHGQQPTAVVHRREDGALRSERLSPTEALALVAEPRHAEVERVDLALPNELLAGGLALVDMPGWGGIDGGATTAALSFVSVADAVLFVTDASSELSAPELDLLRDIRARCNTVVACLTKIDLHPDWRRIAELDRLHLAGADIDVPVVPVSAALRFASLELGQAGLADSSGVPALRDLLLGEVVPRARANVELDAVEVATAVTRSVLAMRRLELDALRAPGGSDLEAAFAASQERAERIRGLATRWPSLLNERMGQLSNEIGYELRSALRDLAKLVDERVEAANTAEAWDDVGRRLQREVTITVEAAYAALATGADAVAADMASLLDITVDAPEGTPPQTVELPEIRRSEGSTQRRRAAGAGLQAFDALRGAAGGVIVLGLLSTTLPAVAGAVVLSNPFTIGIGLFAGGRTLVDGRSRRITQQRAQARSAMRQFLDDIQFTVGNELASAAREIHVELRDRVVAAIEAFQRDVEEVVAAAARTREADVARAGRASVLEAQVGQLERALAEAPSP